MTSVKEQMSDLALTASLKRYNLDENLVLQVNGERTTPEQVHRVALDYKWRGAWLDYQYNRYYALPDWYGVEHIAEVVKKEVVSIQALATIITSQVLKIESELVRVLEEVLKKVSEYFDEASLANLQFNPSEFSWKVLLLPGGDGEWSVEDAEQISAIANEIVLREVAPLEVEVWQPD